jgi:serine/threonine protein kinase
LITLGNAIASKKPVKSIPAVYSQKLKSLIEKLMSKNPFERPTAQEAIEKIGGISIRENIPILDKNHTSLQYAN